MYQVQVVWNREFNWSYYGDICDTLEKARLKAISILDSGDGTRVKKVQVINDEHEVIIPSYKIRNKI